MVRRFWREETGFTLVEVMVAATVFMLGFSLLIAMANSSLARFSTRELEQGRMAGVEAMRLAQARSDTTNLDSVVVCSGLHLRIVRQIMVDENLAKARIQVRRQKTDRLIADFYSEYALAVR